MENVLFVLHLNVLALLCRKKESAEQYLIIEGCFHIPF